VRVSGVLPLLAGASIESSPELGCLLAGTQRAATGVVGMDDSRSCVWRDVCGPGTCAVGRGRFLILGWTPEVYLWSAPLLVSSVGVGVEFMRSFAFSGQVRLVGDGLSLGVPDVSRSETTSASYQRRP